MSDTAIMAGSREIVIDEVFPHTLDVVWKTLTSPAMMSRWLHMEPIGFKPIVGARFTYQTTPAGEWDGVIHCQVLEVTPNERLAYAWKGGHEANVGYGSRLDTVVTFVLSAVETGTRLRLVHSGFVLPRNETAFKGMSEGWKTVARRIDALAAEQAPPSQR
jgi:uncharacterized protein YndB with AHSA1/START domain